MPKKKTKTAIVVGAALLFVCGAALLLVKHERTVHLERVQGAWEGAMHFHGGPLLRTQRVVLRVFNENGSYHAAYDEIDTGRKNLPATQFDVGRTSVNFASGAGFSFRGIMDSDATKITGRWTWPGGRFSQPLTLTHTTAPDTVPEPLAEADYTPRAGSDLQGFWKGTLTIGKTSLRLHLKIEEPPDGSFRAELDSIDQPPVIPLATTTMEYHKPSLRFSFQGIGAAFDGQLNDGGSQIIGKWTQAGVTPLTFDRVNAKEEEQALEAGKNYSYSADTELQGHWTGTLPSRYGLHLRLVFNIALLADGKFSATLDSPDQSLYAMPFDVIAFTPPKVRLEMKSAKCVFEGKLSGGKLSGTWNYDKKTPELLTLERAKSA
jgi:hypothetical protein